MRTWAGKERETDRQTDRHRERDRQTERERERKRVTETERMSNIEHFPLSTSLYKEYSSFPSVRQGLADTLARSRINSTGWSSIFHPTNQQSWLTSRYLDKLIQRNQNCLWPG